MVLVTDGELAAKSENAVEQINSRGGKTAVITCLDDVAERNAERADFVIKIPDAGKYLSPLASAVVLQLLAYRTAVILGRDPDKPRNLAKSVTVE